MRNLYRRLGITPKANRAEIFSAIKKCQNQMLKDDATATIFDNENRPRYDRLNDTMVAIGELRSGMGLTHTEHWDSQLASEYCSEKPKHVGILQDIDRRIQLQKDKQERRVYFRKGWRRIKIAAALCVLGYVGFTLYEDSQRSSAPSWKSTPSATASAPAATPPAPSFYDTHSPASRPASGTVTNLKGTPLQAPFAIETSAGADYYIKLKENGRDAVTIYVRGGQNVEVDVPLGTYEMTYAAGETWYGTEHHFGPDTGYSKSDSRLSFEVVGNQITGYTVTLYQVFNGNMHTRDIPKSLF